MLRGDQKWMYRLVAVAASVLFAATISTTPVTASALPGGTGRIAFDRAYDGGSDIFSIATDGSDPVNLTDGRVVGHGPAWSPDGSKLAFYGNPVGVGCTAIWVMDADGGHMTQLTPGTDCDAVPTWSPDGSRIAFERPVQVGSLGSSYDIMVMNADGSRQTDLTQSFPENEMQPAWSPDGRKIAYFKSGYLYTINPDGSHPTNLLIRGSDPSWSPDATRLAFVRDGAAVDGGAVYDIFTANADGSGETNLTQSSSRNFGPAWSPDGSRVVFETTRDASSPTTCDGSSCNYEIYSMSSSGGSATRLTDYLMSDRTPDWQSTCTIRGAGTIRGTDGSDVICGSPGADTIYANGGNDVVLAGAGNDSVQGGKGSDFLWGQGGNDRIVGGPGNDSVGGAGGSDTLNTVDHVQANDWLDAGAGRDTCHFDKNDAVWNCP
jgi:Ca2+-binding RTX toxin-like protein